MPWEPWLTTEERTLARYASPDSARLLQLPPGSNPADFRADEDGKYLTLQLLYEALAGSGINYDLEPFSLQTGFQRIRPPTQILGPPRQGTCLDLALLVAGLCMHYELLPLIVALKGHALVAVSRNLYHRDAGGSRREELRFFEHGMLPEGQLEALRELVDTGEYMALECTGFAFARNLSEQVPEGAGRFSGRMPFERALDAGREQLDVATRPFLFALDVFELRRVGLEPYTIDAAAPPRDNEARLAPAPELGRAGDAPAEQPGPAAVIEEGERRHLEGLRGIHEKRLRVLEGQAARYGELAVPAHVATEIDEIREKIADINRKLGRPAVVEDSQPVLPPAPARSTPGAQTPSPGGRVAALRKASLQRRLDDLTEEYEAVDRQRASALNPADLVRLKRQLDDLSAEMQRVEEELNNLA